MGYCIDVAIDSVCIKGKNVAAALQAMAELMGAVQQRGGGGSFPVNGPPVRHYSWVDTQTVLDAVEKRDLAAAISEWRYVSEGGLRQPLEQLAGLDELPFGDVVVNYFSGEKAGQDEELWEALAPYVEDGGIITYRGEDGAKWRYVFEGGELQEQFGETVWR